MKRVFNVLVLVVFLLCLCGCVKMNAGMTINKDKSMDFEMLMAVNKEYMSDSDFNQNMFLDEENIDKMKENGFTVHDYNQNDMVGYKITKKFENIDKMSSTDEVEFKFNNFTEGFNDNTSLFKVKKGLFKNTYTVKITDISNSSDMMNPDKRNDAFSGDIDNFDFDSWGNDDWIDGLMLDPNESYQMSFLENSDDMDFSDMAEMMASMEVNFTVKLPYAAKNTNASGLNNDGKDLSWNLINSKLDYISFEFELYNLSVVYGAVGLVVVVIGFLFFSILKGRRGPKAGEVVLSNPVVNNGSVMGQSLGEDVKLESVPNADPVPVVGTAIDMMGTTNVNDGLLINPNASNEVVNPSPIMDLSMPSGEIRQVESVPQVSLNEQIVQNNLDRSNINGSVQESSNMTMNVRLNINTGFDQNVNNSVNSLENLEQNVVQNEIKDSSNVIQPKPVQQSLFLEIEEPNNTSVDGNNENGQLQ